jgi:peroxiredoxin/predicted 2-oxoglutarate/Fe(II)-dependent dioxygenase YbiX
MPRNSGYRGIGETPGFLRTDPQPRSSIKMQPALRLDVGDFMPDFQLKDQSGTYRSLLSLALGKPLVVLLCPANEADLARDALKGLAELNRHFAECATVIVINGESVERNGQLVEALALPFDVLADPENWVLSIYDHRKRALDGEITSLNGSLACVVADANRRIAKMWRNAGGTQIGHEALQAVRALPREAPREIRCHAPVLIVPGVFDRTYCTRLIDLHRTGNSQPTGITRGDHRHRTTVIDTTAKIRRDHFVVDPTVGGEIKALLTKRVLPELMKAFDFRPKRGERFKLTCYDSSEGGFFDCHRDNVDPTEGRRFAMSLNLNTEAFDGGCLRFPEYGPDLYRPETGAALLFSCQLAHEVTPVTRGRRYALLTFFH